MNLWGYLEEVKVRFGEKEYEGDLEDFRKRNGEKKEWNLDGL